jgi:hypothetical protein
MRLPNLRNLLAVLTLAAPAAVYAVSFDAPMVYLVGHSAVAVGVGGKARPSIPTGSARPRPANSGRVCLLSMAAFPSVEQAHAASATEGPPAFHPSLPSTRTAQSDGRAG